MWLAHLTVLVECFILSCINNLGEGLSCHVFGGGVILSCIWGRGYPVMYLGEGLSCHVLII